MSLAGRWVLVPVVAEILDRLTDGDGFGIAVRPCRIEHQPVVAAGLVAHQLAGLDVVSNGHAGFAAQHAALGRRVQLVRIETLVDVGRRFFCVGLGVAVYPRRHVRGQLVAHRAEQAMYRKPRCLARDVPAGDVDVALHSRVHAAPLAPQFVPDGADVERIATDEDRLALVDDLIGDVGTRRADERVSLDAFVGVDSQHGHLHRWQGHAGGQLAFVYNHRHVGDLHPRSHSARVASATRVISSI